MISYADQRARRMWAAHDDAGTDRPPYPFQAEGRCIGRVLMRPLHFRGSKLLGMVPFDRLMEIEFKAREKRQNRARFTQGD